MVNCTERSPRTRIEIRVLQLVAVLSFGFARLVCADTDMPARFEWSSIGKTSVVDIDYSATLEFSLPKSGQFSVEGTGSIGLTLKNGLSHCTQNHPQEFHVKISGTRDGQQLKFTIETKVTSTYLKIDCPENEDGITSHGRSTIPLQGGTSPETTLYVADKATRTLSDFESGSISGKSTITLRLACPVTAQRPSPPAINMTPVLGQDPWPLVLDHTKSSDEIKALKVTPTTNVSLGLTVYKGPKITAEKSFQEAQFGGGLCVWVSKITIDFAPIRMFIASKYAPNTCQYGAIKAHEDLHYQDFSALLRKSQQQMKEAILAADLPSVEHPWHVQDEAEGDRLINSQINEMFKPLVSVLMEKGNEERAARDTAENTDSVFRQCINW